MGYTEESMRSMRYKMSVYDDFTEEYDYRVKYNRNSFFRGAAKSTSGTADNHTGS